jgi:hypothetical protein
LGLGSDFIPTALWTVVLTVVQETSAALDAMTISSFLMRFPRVDLPRKAYARASREAIQCQARALALRADIFST